ncbi:MAG: molybdenum ABC transporter ATP-binding protein [Bacillota bacterium]
MTSLHFQCRHRYPSGFELDAVFDVGDGVTAIFGPSGSGKSTILSIMAGILRPQSARIEFNGQVLVDTAARICLPPEDRRIGFVFQDHLLFPHVSVKENLLYGLRRRPLRHIDFDRLVQILDLGELLDRYPHTLSGGQRQRVALGRALLRGPELLLMDEPLAALDAAVKDRILSYLERAIGEWKVPTLFVSHDQTDVRRLAERVLILESGRVVDTGPTSTTLDRAVLVKMGSHPGPVNLLCVSHIHRTGEHWEGRIGLQPLYLPGELELEGPVAYVRFMPKDVTLGQGDVAGVSTRNRLRGTVREIITVDHKAFVAIDVGQFLWAEVTLDAVRELGLRAGGDVVCLIKASVIQVVG